MYGELYQYLILHKQLDLPGIGTLLIEKKSAHFDVADKVVNPPSYTIGLYPGNGSGPAKKFFNWLGSKLDITERDAVIRFNDLLFDLKRDLSAGKKLEWAGVGIISRGLGGDIRLDSSLADHSPATSIPAIKVLRENAQHIIRVGEEQRTSSQMWDILHPTEERKRSWRWAAALVIVILSVIFIGYYFSVHGLTTSSASNQQKLVPQAETKTH